MALTIFFDADCPLCAIEMKALTERDQHHVLHLENIWQPDFTKRFPSIDPDRANAVLHALDDDGQLLLGLDVTATAWSLVGVRRYNWLRWPLIKPVADFFYHRFANNRYVLSKLLTGRSRTCSDGRCEIPNKGHQS